MDHTKTLELEILIAISQNRKVPVHHFPMMFEHKWKLYNPTFNELVKEGLFRTEMNTGLPFYELTGKGKVRISDLIDQRERDVEIRLSNLKKEHPVAAPGLKSILTFLSSMTRFRVTSDKVKNSELLSG